MFKIEASVLLIIDVQGKLASLMYDRDRVIKNIQALVRAAQILDIPIMWTEQVPEKLGPTVPEIAALLHYSKPIKKSAFSCCRETAFLSELKKLKRRQVILGGIETHVCVYQTAVDLVDLKYEVQVVGDAVSSRTPENKDFGLKRIGSLGATVTCSEMIICELLGGASHRSFKEVLNLIK